MKPTEQKLLDLLNAKGAQTAKQLSEALGVTVEHTRRLCRTMADERLIVSVAEKPLMWASAEMNKVIDPPAPLAIQSSQPADDLDALIQRAKDHNAKLREGIATLQVEVQQAEDKEKKTAELTKLKDEEQALLATLETLRGRLNKLQQPTQARS